MAFHEVQFPTRIGLGSSGGPGFNTYVIEVDSGQEERVARRGQARCSYNVASGLKKQEDVYDLITFFRARLGSAYGFRYKDWSDYATTSSGVTYGSPDGIAADTVTHTDATIGVGDGATTQFQLIKQYISGPVTRNRTINKPVSGTVKIGLDGVNQASGWTVDTTTGVVTFTTAPGSTVVVTAGFEFDVPVRFGEEVDKGLPVRLEEYRNGTVDVPLIELLDEGVSADEYFYGGAIELASAANIALSGATRVWIINMTASGKKVILPATTDVTPGGPLFFIINGGSNSFELVDSALASLSPSVTLAAGDGVNVLLSRDAIGTKVWYTC